MAEERAAAMYARYQEGLSLTDVAAEFGITRQGVAWNFKKRGWELRPKSRDMDLADRLLSRSVVVESGCRRWQGAHTQKGYGQIHCNGRLRQVHRVAYEAWNGPIPEGFEVDHVRANGCRHRDCIEPTHLEAVTHAENVRRTPREKQGGQSDA